jgi:hypothetical protein
MAGTARPLHERKTNGRPPVCAQPPQVVALDFENVNRIG